LYICTYLQNLCALSSTGYWYNTYTQSFDRYRVFFYRNSQFLYRVIIIKTKIIWQSKTTMKRLNNFRTSYTCMHIVNVGHRVWNTLQRHPKLLKKEKCWKKTEAKIWNGQHRDTDNIWDKTQIEDKHSHCQFDKSLWVIEERENLRKTEKIHCLLCNAYFVTVN
jgi:hypothetical protein